MSHFIHYCITYYQVGILIFILYRRKVRLMGLSNFPQVMQLLRDGISLWNGRALSYLIGTLPPKPWAVSTPSYYSPKHRSTKSSSTKKFSLLGLRRAGLAESSRESPGQGGLTEELPSHSQTEIPWIVSECPILEAGQHVRGSKPWHLILYPSNWIHRGREEGKRGWELLLITSSARVRSPLPVDN